MMEKEEENVETTRIFVGGLGESVRDDDLHKLVSPLGIIQGLEIIRTKGRSFAYIDFLPCSNKSLSKLFSMYNGCVWKGGRLRLEKAKEHYLVRLGREWAQHDDAQLNQETPRATKLADSNTPHHLNIFFPRSRKVKSLPLGGTGKHKYSFQRVDVPSLPVYFCDCEQHSVPSHNHKQKQVCDMETQTGGMNQHEVNIMNSVMEMLFQKEDVSSTTLHSGMNQQEVDIMDSMTKMLCERENVSNPSPHSGTELVKEGDNSSNSIEDNEADYTEDEDNLIINVVSKDNDRMALLGGQLQKTISANRESRFSNKRAYKDELIQKVLQEDKRDIVPPNKKRKSHLSEESDRNELVSANSGGSGKLQTQTSRLGTPLGAQPIIPPNKTKSCLSEESDRNELVSATSGGSRNSQARLNESGTPLGAQPTVPESGVKQSTPSLLWLQKSSWRVLVGDGANSAFSVSDILPDTNKEEPPRSDCPNVLDSTISKKQNKIKHKNLEDQWGKTKVEEALAEAQPSPPTATLNKLSEGSSWFQKSSWTQMVSENNSSFSITQILPGITFEKQKLIEPNSVNVATSTDNKRRDLVKTDKSDPARDGSITVGHGKEEDVVQSASEKNQETLVGLVGNTKASDPMVEEKRDLTPKKASNIDVSIGETCSFMRSAASLKQWANTKAALSKSQRRKSDEK